MPHSIVAFVTVYYLTLPYAKLIKSQS